MRVVIGALLLALGISSLSVAPANLAAIRFVRSDLSRVGSAFAPKTGAPEPCRTSRPLPGLSPYFEGLHQLASGCPDAAVAPLRVAASGGNDNARAYLPRALFEAGLVADAMSAWIDLDLSGERPGLVARIAALFAERFERRTAIGLIEAYLAQIRARNVSGVGTAEAYYQLGKNLAEEGETQSAVLWLRRAIDHQPDDDLAWFQLGRVFAENRRHGELDSLIYEMGQRFPGSGLPLLLEGLASDDPALRAKRLVAGVDRLPMRIPYTWLADEMRLIALGGAISACDRPLVASLADDLGRRRPDLMTPARMSDVERVGVACAAANPSLSRHYGL